MEKRSAIFSFCILSAVLATVISGCEGTSGEDNGSTTVKPVIVVEDTLVVPSTEGSAVLEYSISNPVEGGVVTALCNDSWITGVNSDVEGEISFDVQENTRDIPRTSVMRLVYFYGEDTVQNETLIYQEPVPMSYDVNIGEAYFYGVYSGTVGDGYNKFMVYLSDMPFVDGSLQYGASQYTFVLYSNPLSNRANYPQDGVYEYVATRDNPVPFTFDNSSWWYQLDEDGFFGDFGNYEEGSTLTVSSDGDVYTYEARITDIFGTTHYVKAVTSESFVEN